MGLGIPKDLIIVFIIALFYGYGTRSFFNGVSLFCAYLIIRFIWNFLTRKKK